MSTPFDFLPNVGEARAVPGGYIFCREWSMNWGKGGTRGACCGTVVFEFRLDHDPRFRSRPSADRLEDKASRAPLELLQDPENPTMLLPPKSEGGNSMSAPWIVNVKGGAGLPSFEISVVRSDNSHGQLSYGWFDEKKLLISRNGGPCKWPVTQFVWDRLLVVAEQTAAHMNALEEVES